MYKLACMNSYINTRACIYELIHDALVLMHKFVCTSSYINVQLYFCPLYISAFNMILSLFINLRVIIYILIHWTRLHSSAFSNHRMTYLESKTEKNAEWNIIELI